MVKFEKVSRFADADFPMPARKTVHSAGYDFAVAEEIIIPPLKNFWETLKQDDILSLDEMAALTKKTKAKPSLVSTGVKCKMEEDHYLELMVRSSTPLKYWLVMANGVGIVDADYYNNPDNEGEIFLEIINLSPNSIVLRPGDIIGQGIIKSYVKIDDDNTTAEREGGFGSTTWATAGLVSIGDINPEEIDSVTTWAVSNG